jgi:phosphatidylglycerophosphatase A
MMSDAANTARAETEAGSSKRSAPLWATLVATFFGTGWLKPGPGTWGSLATVILWAVISQFLPPAWVFPANLFFAILAVAVGIPAATSVARATGTKDPQFVVVDETAGQLVTLLGAPLSWKSFLAGFILFRAFDIVKPYPVRQLERLPEGIGIVIDDVAAGLYALAVMQLLLHFGLFGH